MTRAEAAKMLNRLLLYCDECPHGDCEKCVEAINMAEDALEQQTCDNCKFNEETDGMNCYECLKGMNDNFEALDQEPSRATGKWIPVSERLPSESDYYLATLKSSFETEVAIIWFAHIDDYGSKSEWREITDDDTVVAWMPLPEPYKESEEEQTQTFGFCVYHEIECDYKGLCIECPHNTKEDKEWFEEDERKERDTE